MISSTGHVINEHGSILLNPHMKVICWTMFWSVTGLVPVFWTLESLESRVIQKTYLQSDHRLVVSKVRLKVTLKLKAKGKRVQREPRENQGIR